ncbi:hypothetical protein RMCBS344292_10264 [Rhizopus microsporus]|nr:hypothetical protein RMCBS344292_10264 [Rhizopus microsporus]
MPIKGVYHYLVCRDLKASENNAVEELAEFDSFLSNETDLTYKIEPSTHYTENLKLKQYVLTLHELNTYEEKHEVYLYDDGGILDERFLISIKLEGISAINFNATLPQNYRRAPVILKANTTCTRK